MRWNFLRKITELSGCIITETMHAQCDINRNEYLLLEAFINQIKDGSALSGEDQKIIAIGQEALRKSTAGWGIYCKWKDGSTLWEKLSNLKELHLIYVAKYAIAQGILCESAINWWVHHVLQKRDNIISNEKWHSA